MNFRPLLRIGIKGICKTLYHNFRLLPIRQAVRLPILVSGKVKLRDTRRGNIIFNNGVKPLCLYLGADLTNMYDTPSLYRIMGKMIVNGSGSHVIGVGSVVIVNRNGILTLGDNLSIGNTNRIYVTKEVTIGDNNLWSHCNIVRDSDGHSIIDSDGNLTNDDKPITFGNKVWMGASCTVLKGADIPNDSVIASISLITKELPPPIFREMAFMVGFLQNCLKAA